MKAVALTLIMICLAAPLHAQEQVDLKTESYPPFSYRDADGIFKGVSVDQVEALMHDAGLPYSLEMMPWARAIALAETRPHTCVFSAALTTDRQDRFKWVRPLSSNTNILVRHTTATIDAKTIEEAKQYTVGTHRDDYTESLLSAWGFPKLEISTDFETSLRKLMDRRIDMMPMSENVYNRLKRYGAPIQKVMQFAKQQFGIACNKDTSDETIARMQKSLDQLKSSGRQTEIYRRYNLEQSN